MSIEIHCDHCGKLIRAPESAAGRRGKCPYCDQSVYIPTPSSQLEEIPLAPLDESDEQRMDDLRRESAEYAAMISKAQAGKYDVGDAAPAGGEGIRPPTVEETLDLQSEVEEFVLAMAASRLDAAEGVVTRLKRVRKRASDYVQGLMLDEMPQPIGKVPMPLMKGLLKKLSERLRE